VYLSIKMSAKNISRFSQIPCVRWRRGNWTAERRAQGVFEGHGHDLTAEVCEPTYDFDRWSAELAITDSVCIKNSFDGWRAWSTLTL
jgi:hypothetical protein